MAEVDNIEVRFLAVGQGPVVSAFEQVSSASIKTEASVKRFDSAVDGVNKRTFANFNEAAGKGTKLLGTFAMAASQAEPALGKLGSTAMRTAETVMSFGMYLGGPWGIALGGAVAAIAALTSHLNENAEAAKKNALAMLEAEEAADDFEAQVAAAYTRSRTTGLLPVQQEALDRLNQEAALEEATGGVGKDITSGGPARRGAGPEFEAMQRRSENEARITQLRDQESAANARAIESDLMREQAASDARLEIKRVQLDQQFEMENAAREQTLAAEDAMYAQSASAAEAHGEMVRAAGSGAFNAVATVGIGALQKLAKGQKTSLKEFIGGIGDLLVAQGTADLARAGAMLFIPGLQGNAGGLAAAAGVEISTGLAMGAVGASGGGGGGGGGVGVRAPHARRGESGGDYLDRTRAESPTSSRMSGGGQGGVTVVNVQLSSTISPNADDAIRIEKAVREGKIAGVLSSNWYR